MANIYTPALQTVIAQFFLRLRAQALATKLFDRSFDPAPAQKGDTINVTIPTNYTAQAVTPNNALQAGVDSTPVKGTMTLNQWWEVPITISDKNLSEIQRGVLDAEINSMSVALVEKINSDVYGESRSFFNQAGAAATNPFATNEDPFLLAMQLLDQEKAPQADRYLVMNPAAKAKALKIAGFVQASIRGTPASPSALITGSIGQAYGAEALMDQLVYSTVSTPLTAGAATVNGAQGIGNGSTDNNRTGTVSIAKATNSSPLVRGDTLLFSGDTQFYTVLADITLAVGNTTVAIAPALRTAKAGGETVTLTASAVINPVAQKNALTFASRPVGAMEGVGIFATRIDPVTGVALTVELQRQHYQTRLSVSCLYAVKSFRPELGCRLLG